MTIFTIRRAAASLLMVLVCLFPAAWLWAGPSTITVVDGLACMGDDKSRQQTEQDALAGAKRKAVEYASTYLKSETHLKDFQVEKDLVDAYAHATIRIIEEVEKGWYRDEARGECYRVKVKAEVIPDDGAMAQLSRDKGMMDDPSAPLNVRLWTDKSQYAPSEKIRIYLKGNKPFYARVLYRDIKGDLLQLLPNAYRRDHHFLGGVVYEIPSANDRFELEVSPPFGEESITVYGSLTPLGDLRLQDTGAVYQVQTAGGDVGVKTRGVTLKGREEGKGPAAAEFFEGRAIIRTGP
jgi:hypothetical protein